MATSNIKTDDSNSKNMTKLNIKVIDNDKNTKLHYLAACGQPDKISRDLIEKQRIDIENYLGWTALMMACKNGHFETVKLLLDLGADPSRKNRFGVSVFLISIASGNLDIVMLILQHLLCGGISKRSLQSIFSPLSIAVLFANHSILKFLIQQEFDVNGVTPHTGVTPMMFAAAMEDEQSFTLLLASKADPSIKNYIGLTASDIKKAREVKEEKQTQQPLKPPQLTPAELISNSPHMNPFTNRGSFVSPHPTFLVWTPEQMIFHHIRKSSNTATPSPNCLIATPHLTPIGAMALVPQIFFPQDFNPGNVSPNAGIFQNSFNNAYDLLNARLNTSQMNQSGMFLSPSYNPTNSFLSPCV